MPGRLKPVVVFVVGPSAAGKTRLSVKLAKRIKGEVVSADSMQVYRLMRVLSQAPRRSEMSGIRHHLVSALDVSSEYNVNIFRNKATEAIRAILRRGKTPIVTGGSGLYVKALIDGLFPSPEADAAFRDKMNRSIERYGSRKAHRRLAAIDPKTAASIHPNDARRVIRALEIYHATGRTMTELKRGTKGLKSEFRIKIFGLIRPRNDIYRSVENRVDEMFADGIVREVRRLSKRRMSRTSSAALGIKEVLGYLRGEYGIDEAKDLLKMNTRRFVKRQLTWFRADKRIRWLNMSRMSDKEAVECMSKAVSYLLLFTYYLLLYC
jgi:tRNA dimethylallyltransferase